MDREKVSAVKDLSTPTSQKEVQWFLDFANFYQKLIRNFKSVASPLHVLNFLCAHPFCVDSTG